MKSNNKLIKSKLGLLKLAENLGNVSQACKVMGYSRIVSAGLNNCTIPVVIRPFMR